MHTLSGPEVNNATKDENGIVELALKSWIE